MSGPNGSISALMDALVGLEETIDPGNLRVYRWQPAKIETPAIYNWIVPSQADIPAINLVRDQLELAVRIVVSPSDPDEESARNERYWDLARDVIDGDLVRPSDSVLLPAAYMVKRTRSRNIVAIFNDVPYLGLELTLQCELRRLFA